MTSPIEGSLLNMHMGDIFRKGPKPAEEIQSMAAESLDSFQKAKTNKKKDALGRAEIVRIEKYASDGTQKAAALKALELAGKSSTSARVALYGAALATMAHSLGAAMPQALSRMAAEAIQYSTTTDDGIELQKAVGEAVMDCATKEDRDFLDVMNTVSASFSENKFLTARHAGFLTLAEEPGKPLEEQLLRAAINATDAKASDESRATVAGAYLKTLPLSIPLAPGAAASLTAEMTSRITALQNSHATQGAYFDIMARITDDPKTKALTAAAASALSPITTDKYPLCRKDEPAGKVSSMVLDKLKEPSSSGEILLQACRELDRSIDPADGHAAALRPFLQQLEASETDETKKSLIRAALSCWNDKRENNYAQSAAFSAVLEALESPSDDRVALFSRTALKAMEQCRISDDHFLEMQQGYIARAFLAEIAGDPADPVAQTLAKAVFPVGDETVPPKASIEIVKLLAQKQHGSLEEEFSRMMLHYASIEPVGNSSSETAAFFARRLSGVMTDKNKAPLVEMTGNIKGCRNTSYCSTTLQFPNSDIFAIRALEKVLNAPGSGRSIEQDAADLALAALSKMNKNYDEIHTKGADYLSRPFMEGISRITGDPRISRLIATVEEAAKPLEHSDRNTSLAIYTSLFSIISNGLPATPGEEYAKMTASLTAFKNPFRLTTKEAARRFMEKCAGDSQDPLMKSLMPITAHLGKQSLYDSYIFLYQAMADLFLAPHDGISPEKAMADITNQAISRMETSSHKEKDKTWGIYDMAGAAIREIGAMSQEQAVKDFAALEKEIPLSMDQNYLGNKIKNTTEREESHYDGPAACARAILKALPGAAGTAPEKLYAAAAADAMSMATTAEGRVVAARPFMKALAPLVTDPCASALLVEKLPNGANDYEAAFYSAILETLDTSARGGKPQSAYLAAKGLQESLAAPENAKTEIAAAFLRSVEISLLAPGTTVDNQEVNAARALARIAFTPMRNAESKASLILDALQFAANPQELKEPVIPFLAARALEQGKTLAPYPRLHAYYAVFREIATQLKDKSTAVLFKDLCEVPRKLDDQVRAFEKALQDIVDVNKSLNSLNETNEPGEAHAGSGNVQIHQSDSGKDFLDIDGIRLVVRKERADER